MQVLMVASENDALPGAKVGGIADVVRDLPGALSGHGVQCRVLIPSYGVFHQAQDARVCGEFSVPFAGGRTSMSVWRRELGDTPGGVQQLVLHSDGFAPGTPGQIYCDDPSQHPFATDASKFALFCAGVCEGMVRGAFGAAEVLHLHDWHTAMVLLLRAFDPRYAALRRLRCVFTIHNLALQGIRPLRGGSSSLRSWFPALEVDAAAVADPRWPECINPMAVGIRLADAVNTVSPSYAGEILAPNDVPGAGFHGGEGLEADLRTVHAGGRLHGILNGCPYPTAAPAKSRSWSRLRDALGHENLLLAARDATLSSAHFIAARRIEALGRKRPSVLITSVGRVVEQKLGLLREPVEGASSALDAMLQCMDDRGLYVLVGSGDASLEAFLREASARHRNFLFIRGYTAELVPRLYRSGDLFLMPSSYEPCGISQMLAMRDGQPCLVHAVGGLRDTVTPRVNGFAFDGTSRAEQAAAMVRTFEEALTLLAQDPERYRSLRDAAARARFEWSDSAIAYRDLLYLGVSA